MKLRAILVVGSLMCFCASANANGLSDYNMVKTLDGGSAYCSTGRDIGRRAYLPTQTSAVSDGLQLQVDITVKALVCQDSTLTRDWVGGLFLESYASVDLKGRPIKYVARYQDLVLVDTTYTILAKQELQRQPEAVLSATVSLSTVLDGSDYRALTAGQKVTKRLEFFLRSQFDIETEDQLIKGNLAAAGTYSMMLEFRRDARNGMIGVRTIN